ncbi:hypothetical protein P4O66_015151 [Electrophorus voltai]|uniref:Uncharacterized protein n=1 Tax=Electrophorus voltai TaxID=2609070 RepID=A0AAD8Z0A0_9TELE|nr:hypothetical protein P4O66_015151 [Electrophorus voltai]
MARRELRDHLELRRRPKQPHQGKWQRAVERDVSRREVRVPSRRQGRGHGSASLVNSQLLMSSLAVSLAPAATPGY